jgi:hypothetical protein
LFDQERRSDGTIDTAAERDEHPSAVLARIAGSRP